MPFRISVSYKKTFPSQRTPEATMAYLANCVEHMRVNFPGLESFEQVKPGIYHWTFEKLKQAGHELQLKVATKITPEGKDTLVIQPMTEPGFSTGKGAWKVTPQGTNAQVTFELSLDLELNLSFLLKPVAAPIAQTELTKVFDRYVASVTKILST